MKTSIPEEVSAEELADLLGVTPKTVRNHADRGVIVRASRGKYLIAESVRNLLADARKASRSNDLDKEQLALMREKRKAAELRNAEAEGRVIDLEEAFAVLDLVIATYRIGLDRLPARITRDVTLRKQIKAECDNTLTEASKKFQDFAHNPPTTNPANKETSDDD